MRKRHMTAVLMLVALLGVTGCATTSSLVEDKDKGTTQVYQVSTTQAWTIAKAVMRWEDLTVVEEHPSRGYLVARTGKEWVPWTTMTIAWVESVDKRRTKVTVVAKRRAGMKAGGSETTFHKHFAQAVGIVRAGKIIPAEAPAQN
jgi:hypothetical protein